MKKLLVAIVLLAACAAPTGPEQKQLIGRESIPSPFVFILDTVATGNCCGGSQWFPYPKPRPKKPIDPGACPIMPALHCMP